MSMEIERPRQAFKPSAAPTVSDHDEARRAAPPPLGSASAGEQRHGKQRALRILIVEDEIFVAMDTEVVLLSAGHSVVGIVTSADDAIKAARDAKPDLVLMDVRLVGARDGIDAAIEIKARFGTPIIFVTAHNDLVTASRAAKASPLAIVAKPVVVDSLLAAISMLP